LGVVTEIGPVVAPLGTVAWISESESTVKLAAVLLKVTTMAPVNLEPRMSTLVPTGPVVGVKELMAGAGTAKEDELEPLPFGVHTEIGPVVAPLGTVAWISESESTVKFVVVAPPKPTEVAAVKFDPRMSTLVPTGPPVGVNELTVGANSGWMTVKEDELLPLPLGPVTEITPVVAPLGTIAWISLSESTVKVASAPSNVTLVAPVKYTPLRSTLVPAGPVSGVNELIAVLATTVSSTSTE